MTKKNLKGIYLHGYKGYVTEEKHIFLTALGEIEHPNVDYDNHPTIILDLLEKYKDESIDFVAGTSLGGILIYHLAKALNVPVLLLNPAVTALDMIQDFIPKQAQQNEFTQPTMVLVGKRDEIVAPELQLEYFQNEAKLNPNIKIITREELGHFVPIKEFTEAFEAFEEML